MLFEVSTYGAPVSAMPDETCGRLEAMAVMSGAAEYVGWLAGKGARKGADNRVSDGVGEGGWFAGKVKGGGVGVDCNDRAGESGDESLAIGMVSEGVELLIRIVRLAIEGLVLCMPDVCGIFSWGVLNSKFVNGELDVNRLWRRWSRRRVHSLPKAE
jgi:hypothetical protein